MPRRIKRIKRPTSFKYDRPFKRLKRELRSNIQKKTNSD